MIRIESTDLDRLVIGARVYPKPLRVTIRKSMRAAALDAANASKAKIRGMPVKGDVGYRQGTGMRSDIANAIKVSTSVGTLRGAQARIYISKTPALQAHRRFRVPQLLDKGKKFRHPYFGEWVEGEKDQEPYPFFKSVVATRAPAVRAALAEALVEAARMSLPNVR